MKQGIITLIIAILSIITVSGQSPVVEVSGDITTNTSWTNDNIYLIKGFVYVKNNATLSIEAGTVVKGDKPTKGSLIVTRTGKLNAEGTPSQPIVFTSNQPIGERKSGDWGGVILLGNAPTNSSYNGTSGIGQIEGGVDNANGDGIYGGVNPSDNSGTLKYVRIEFAGIPFEPNKEINGLTMGGVGFGTTIDHIQVSVSGDDSYEWFGGTVNAKHLVAFKGVDDDFDTDNGFSGNVQFCVSLRDSSIADVSGSNGFESDNDATGSSNQPFTAATFSNVTIVGPKVTATNPYNSNFKRGAHIRRNSHEAIFNTIFLGYPTGLFVDGTPCANNALNGDLKVQNSVIAGSETNLTENDTITSFNIDTWFNAAAAANQIYATSPEVGLTDPFNYTNPDFRPANGSSMLNGAAFTDPRLGSTFFENVSFRGAFGNDNWMENWTEFDPQNQPYTTGFTAVREIDNSKLALKVFPNPAKDMVNISMDLKESMKLEIIVTDVYGQVVAQIPTQSYYAGQQNIELQTAGMNTGVYFIRILSDKGQKVSKISVLK